MYHDPDGKHGRTMSSSDKQVFSDLTWALRFLLRLVFFPVWITSTIIKRRRLHRAKVEFAMLFADAKTVSVRNIAVRWANEHHRDYPLAEYSSNFAELEGDFEAIIAQSPRLKRRTMGKE